MSFKGWHLQFLASLRLGMSRIHEDLGAEWFGFSDGLLILLERLDRESDTAVAERILGELITHTATVSDRCEYVGQVMRQTRPHLLAYRSGPSWENPVLRIRDVYRGDETDASDAYVVDVADINVLGRALADDLRGEKSHAEDAPEARFFNTYFTEDGAAIIPETQPLLHRGSYKLCVDINPKAKGAGAGTKFNEAAVSELQKRGETIPLLVVATSRDFEIRPGVQKIDLPAKGASTEARFSVRPLISGRRGFLQVETFFRGHLLQAKRIDVTVVPDIDSDLPVGLRPAHIERLTFTTTEQFSLDTLDLMPERLLTIDVERDERDQSINLRFLDRTNGEEELATYDTTLEPQALGAAIAAVREKLKVTIRGEQRNSETVEGYEWKINGSDAMLGAWLPLLADVGRNLYRALLPQSQGDTGEDKGQKLRAAMQPGGAIQINPIVGKVTIPWALLYERKVLNIPGTTRVCNKYWQDGPTCPQCESLVDATVICPSGFWGYRYAIEQLPCWVSGELPTPLGLLRRISNEKPLVININVWRRFNLWQQHLENLKGAGTITPLLAEDLNTVIKTWSQNSKHLDVLYFYTHGGIDSGQPYLEVSDGRLVSNSLEATLSDLEHHPLVFLNGCSTGDYGPESFVSLIDDFRKAGAAGVIGTECAVPELFAEAFAARLFPRLFRGDRLGQAMLEIRREFLTKNRNPLGLVYSLYASNEISLNNPVNTN